MIAVTKTIKLNSNVQSRTPEVKKGWADFSARLDNGRIERLNDWKEPVEPFQAFVAKADLIPRKVEQELERHRRAFSAFGVPDGKYGIWGMELNETKGVADFLASQHAARLGKGQSVEEVIDAKRSSRPNDRGASTPVKCQHGGLGNLTARSGRFG